jgi:hypothetical protein
MSISLFLADARSHILVQLKKITFLKTHGHLCVWKYIGLGLQDSLKILELSLRASPTGAAKPARGKLTADLPRGRTRAIL